MATVYIDPVNRIEGHMGVEVELSTTAANATATVASAKVKSSMYRGFENVLYKRPAQDAIQITQRI